MKLFVKLTVCILLLSVSTVQAGIVTTGYISPADPNSWDISTTSYIGDQNGGTLALDGGSFLFSSESNIGYEASWTGSVDISGAGSTWCYQFKIYVGKYGDGTLNISDGGALSGGYTFIAGRDGSTGMATITDSGSTWRNNGTLVVGGGGNGTLNVLDGASVSCYLGLMGLYDTGVGTINISGPNSTLISDTDFSMGSAGIGGSGTVNLTDGGLLGVNQYLNIYDSSINMSTQGMLAVGGDVDDSLSDFLDRVSGEDTIRWWNDSINNWAPITTATRGTDYTLEYLTDGDLAGYTLLTVGAVPEPGTLALILSSLLAVGLVSTFRKRGHRQ